MKATSVVFSNEVCTAMISGTLFSDHVCNSGLILVQQSLVMVLTMVVKMSWLSDSK
jgi:hypothetical protein